MSFGGSSNKTSQNSSTKVWEEQAPFLTGLWNAAQGLMGQQQGQIGPAAQRFSAEGLGAMRGGQAQLADIARTGGNQNLAQIANTGGALAQYANPNNALARQQLQHQATAIGNEFNRVVMPGLNSAAGLAGQRGGSRNQIARGLAASDAQSQIAGAASDLYAQQYGIGAQAAAGATQARLDAASTMTNARLDAAGGMGDMASSIYNLGMSPFTAQWAPLTALAQIIGNPAILAQSKGKGSGKSANVGLF